MTHATQVQSPWALACARMPTPLFHRILAFAAPMAEEHPQHSLSVWRQEMLPFGSVNKAWHALVVALVSFYTLSKLTLRVRTAQMQTRVQLLELRRRVLLRRAYLRELKLMFESDRHDNTSIDRGQELLASRTMAWPALFSQLPGLARLYVVTSDASSPSLLAVLKAAAVHCPNVESLYLSCGYLATETVPRIVDATLCSMEAWRSMSLKRGLRTLTLPIRAATASVEASCAFVSRLSQCSPNLECVEFRSDVYTYIDAQTEDQWFIDHATWEQFCSSCTKLKVFDWTLVPYATAFFQIFAKYVKPHLETMTLTAAVDWDWDIYLAQVDAGTSAMIRATGFEAAATHASDIFKSCPALKDLTITVTASMNTPATARLRDGAGGRSIVGAHQLLSPPIYQMNQEVFGDEFVEALVGCCPRLERFVLGAEDSYLNPIQSVGTILAFTDRALAALGTLQCLTYVKLKSVKITDGGLLDLVLSQPVGYSIQRDYCISVGHSHGKTEMAFYAIVEEFLKLVATHTRPSTWESQRVVLKLTNDKRNDIVPAWGEWYLPRLQAAVLAVKEACPSLRMRILVNGWTGSNFNRIVEFGFYTASATPSPEFEWDDDEGQPIDDVFINHWDGDNENEDDEEDGYEDGAYDAAYADYDDFDEDDSDNDDFGGSGDDSAYGQFDDYNEGDVW